MPFVEPLDDRGVTMAYTASDLFVDRLMEWGVDTIFGLPGDRVNGFARARRVRPFRHGVELHQRRHRPNINPRPEEVIDMATHERTGIGATQRPRRHRGHFGVHDPEPTTETTAPVGTASAAAGARPDAMFAAALEVIAGVWLVISPWVLGYTGDDARWNPIVFGAIVIVLALARAAAGDRAAW